MIKKPWRMERYVMLALIIFAYVIEVIQHFMKDSVFPSPFHFNFMIFLRGSIFLMLVFLHPKHKYITGIAYSLYWGLAFIQSIISLGNIPFQSFQFIQIINLGIYLMVHVFAMITGAFLFFKKDVFHPLYIILPAALIVFSMPQLLISLPSWIMFGHIISNPTSGLIFLLIQIIGFVINIIFFIVLLLFGISLYQMSKENPSKSPSFESSSKSQNMYDMLHELETLYGDGVFSKEEYEAKKQKLLKERA